MDVDNDLLEGQQGSGARATLGSSNVAAKNLSVPRSLKLNAVTFHFKKSRIFYTYGYAFKNVIKKCVEVNLDKGDRVYLTTPLANIPNDMLGFYMNGHELTTVWNYGQVEIKHLKVTVTPQGLRTAFDTGTTLSGTATSEHCTLGCYAVGLNQKNYATGHVYESDVASPMVPTGVSNPKLDNMLKKYYGDKNLTEHGPMCMSVPRHVDLNACLRINLNRSLPHYIGVYQLDRYKHRFNFIPKIGETIINWKYTPAFGFISCKGHDILYCRDESDICYTQNIIDKMPAQITTALTKMECVK
ncbi:unnamed protein product [Psylliodes chrysocephalus]|uniref:Uncharacterized protein n=1 Tax=Psylliodes chrysocephalus TaxID=3402493 RepID=A0A9P0CVK9_9CUCU|nr:unnamed protein product [Psylliodes chrysocephala]